MTARELLHIINNGNNISQTDYQTLVKLHHEYPYFVLPIILAAKYQQKNSPDKDLLYQSATQSPDRKRLKFLIENPIPFLSDNDAIEQDTDQTDISLNDKIAPVSDKSIAEKVEKESDPIISIIEKEVTEGKSVMPLPNRKPVKNQRRDVLKDLEDNLNRLKSTSQDDTPTDLSTYSSEEKTGEPIRKLGPEALMDSIKNREKKHVLDAKKHIQDELIDEFNKKTVKFKVDPNIEEKGEEMDLSIESTRLKENLISESFAKILVKQKKINEAEEIYKKLQLKFPDKKAYFADCLKQLEKN